MNRWIVLISFLFSFLSFADHLVFMRESKDSKHIWLKTESDSKAITTGSLWNLYPTISSDGQWIAWVEGTDEKNTWIKILNQKTKKSLILASYENSRSLHPHFSKNNQYLVFSQRTRNQKNKLQIYDLNQFTQEITQTQTVELEGDLYFPKLSSDGAFLIAQRNSIGKKEIILFDRASKSIQLIAEGMSPSLSFDEKMIVYTSKNKRWGLRLYNRNSKSITVMTDPVDYDDMAPTFDAKNSIFFSSNQTGNFQIYKLQQGEKIKIVQSSEDDYAPQFSGEVNWKQDFLAEMPGPKRSSFAALNFNGKVYICGGHQGSEHTYPPESFNQQLFVFDQTQNKWEELAPRPNKAHGFQMAGYGKYLYAFGGFSYEENNRPRWKSLDLIDRYDIEKNEWVTIGKMPRARSSNVAITIDDKVYLVGGWDSTPKFPNDLDGTFHSEIDVFDFQTETIKTASYQLPEPKRRAFSGTSIDGKILLVGGLGQGASHFELLTQVTLLDPISGQFLQLPSLPFGTFAPAIEILNDELFVFGGMFKIDQENYEYVSHIYALNLKELKWRHTGRFTSETKGFSQVIKLNDDLLGILGGHHYYSNTDSPVSTFETFSSSQTPDLP